MKSWYGFSFLLSIISFDTRLPTLFIIDNVYVRIHPRTGYGITDSIIDKDGNVIDKDGNIIS